MSSTGEGLNVMVEQRGEEATGYEQSGKKRKRSRRQNKGQSNKENVEMGMKKLQKWSDTITGNKYARQAHMRIQQKQTENEDTDKLKKWGDEIYTTDEWPAQSQRSTIRIMGLNVNGISKENELIEWDMLLDNMHQKQVDILCISEINLDTNKPNVKYTLLEKN